MAGKFTFIILCIFIVQALAVVAAPGLSIQEATIAASGDTEQTTQISFTLENTGDQPLNVTFSSTSLDLGGDSLAVEAIAAITDMPATSTQVITADIVVPQNQTPGVYSGSITAQDVTNAVSDPVTVDFTVNQNFAFGPLSKIDLGQVNVGNNVSQTFTLRNTGNADITGITFDFTDNDYNMTFAPENFNLAPGATQNVQLSTFIPKGQGTGDLTFGTVSASSAQLNQNLFEVEGNIEGGLIIEDLDVTITQRDGDSEALLNLRNGDTIEFVDEDEDIEPGTTIKFAFNIENLFSDDDDDSSEIDNVKVTLTIDDIDDGDEIEVESDSFDMNANDVVDVDLIVDIPLKVEAKKFIVKIEVDGNNGETGANHIVEWELDFKVSKDNRDIIVQSARVVPTTINCAGSGQIEATILNIGNDLLNEAGIQIIAPDLGVDYEELEIELEADPFDNDAEYEVSVPFTVLRSDGLSQGGQRIEINALITDNAIWHRDAITLNYNVCNVVVEDQPEPEETEPVVEDEPEQEPEPVEEEAEEVVEVEQEAEQAPETTTQSGRIPVLSSIADDLQSTDGSGDNTALLVMIMLMNVLIVGAIGFALYTILSNKN